MIVCWESADDEDEFLGDGNWGFDDVVWAGDDVFVAAVFAVCKKGVLSDDGDVEDGQWGAWHDVCAEGGEGVVFYGDVDEDDV